MKPFTLDDIGKPVRIIATGEHAEVRQLHHENTMVLLFTRGGFSWHEPSELERGHYETVWVPES